MELRSRCAPPPGSRATGACASPSSSRSYTVRHGHGDDSDAPVRLECEATAGRIALVYEDTAPAHDPFAAVITPDAAAGVEDRPVAPACCSSRPWPGKSSIVGSTPGIASRSWSAVRLRAAAPYRILDACRPLVQNVKSRRWDCSA